MSWWDRHLRRHSRLPQTSDKEVTMDNFVTLPGIRSVSNDRMPTGWRISWAVLLLLGAGFLAYHVSSRVNHYLQNPVNTVVHNGISDSLPFPAVTLCNHNPFVYHPFYSDVESVAQLRKRMHAFLQGLRQHRWNPELADVLSQFGFYDNGDSQMSMLRLMRALSFLGNQRVRVISEQDLLVTRALYDSYQSFNTLGTVSANYSSALWEASQKFTAFQNFSWSTFLRRRGHGLSDTLTQCFFAGRECLASDFESTILQHDTFYLINCHTFNKNGSFRATDRGNSQGLDVSLVTQSANYMLMGERGSFLVIVHRPNVPPDFRDGVSIYSGTNTEFRVRYKEFWFLEDFTNCRLLDTQDEDRPYVNEFCRKRCKAKLVREKCGCRTSDLPSLPNDDRECNLLSAKVLNCLDDIPANFLSSCDCPSECEQVLYRQHVLNKELPFSDSEYREFRRSFLAQIFGTRPPGVNVSANVHEKAELVGLGVQVFFEEMNKETIKQEPAFTFFALMSDVGGALGLVLGGCVLTLMELLQFFVNKCIVSAGRRAADMRRRSRQVSMQTTHRVTPNATSPTGASLELRPPLARVSELNLDECLTEGQLEQQQQEERDGAFQKHLEDRENEEREFMMYNHGMMSSGAMKDIV